MLTDSTINSWYKEQNQMTDNVVNADVSSIKVDPKGDNSDLIVETRDLVKRYGKLTAVNHLSLHVPRGAIYGFVGPNGAGKTSTMRILTTLMLPTSGQAYIAGHEVTKDPRAVRRV